MQIKEKVCKDTIFNLRNRNMSKALVVIDIQNDITKHYKNIVVEINKAIDWAKENGM